MAGLGIHISIQRFARANTRPPLSQLNLRNLGLTSAEIDQRLDYLSGAGINHTEIDLRGNSNPTSASADAIQALVDDYVYINFNKDYTP